MLQLFLQARLLREGRENLLTPAEIAKARNIPAADRARYDRMWAAYDAHNDAVLQFLVDTGVIEQGKKDEWTRYGDYVPFYRVHDETGDLLGPSEHRAAISNPDPKIRRLLGGKAKLGDIRIHDLRHTLPPVLTFSKTRHTVSCDVSWPSAMTGT